MATHKYKLHCERESMERNKCKYNLLIYYSYLVLNLWLHNVRAIGIRKELSSTRSLKNEDDNFGYSENTYLNFTELASKYDYKSEQHQVITDDGYILTAFRIVTKCGHQKRYPVLLMHGIYDSADTWILRGPKTGLGFILANSCYDTWFGNHRGNHYSRNHIKLNPDRDKSFWNYSFDEHGNYDLTAIVDYIILRSGKQKINYIGHSQGTADFFIMTSLKPEYNDKIQLSIQLAPVAFMKNLISPIPIMLASRTARIKYILETLGYDEFLAKNQLTHIVLKNLCQISYLLCGLGLSMSTGYKPGNIHPRTLAVGVGHLFVGTSTKTLAHWGQLITSKKFQRFNEGRQGNIIRYGSSLPPTYNLSRVSAPVVLMCGQNDWLASLEDTELLRSKLPNVVEYYVLPDPSWSHQDHIWGKKAVKFGFSKILNHLDAHN